MYFVYNFFSLLVNFLLAIIIKYLFLGHIRKLQKMDIHAGNSVLDFWVWKQNGLILLLSVHPFSDVTAYQIS